VKVEEKTMVQLPTREVSGVTIIDAQGRITLGEGSRDFWDKLRELVSQGKKKILVNMAGVSYTDSYGIGELVSGFTTVTNHGGQLKILAFQKRVEDLLQCTKLYTVFDVYNDEAAAVRSFN
jgi:anti-sigma B factor antagonist